MTTIIVTHEDNEVDEFEFESSHTSISIGRRSSNDVCVPNLSVSGRHAAIVFKNDNAWLEDLKSTNGTYINGVQISRQEIQDGDEIILGKVKLAFVNASQLSAATNNSTHAGANSALAPSLDLSSGLAQMAQNGSEHVASDKDTSVDLLANSSTGDTKRASSTSAEKVNAAAIESSETPHPLEGVERRDATAVTPMHELDSTPTASKGAVIEIKNGAKSGQILPIDKPVTTLGRPGIQIAAIMRKPDGYFLMHIESDDSVDRPTLNQDVIGDEPVLLHSGDELNVAGIDVEFMLS